MKTLQKSRKIKFMTTIEKFTLITAIAIILMTPLSMTLMTLRMNQIDDKINNLTREIIITTETIDKLNKRVEYLEKQENYDTRENFAEKNEISQ